MSWPDCGIVRICGSRACGDLPLGEVLFGLEWEEKNRGMAKGEDDDDGTAFCLRLNETLQTG